MRNPFNIVRSQTVNGSGAPSPRRVPLTLLAVGLGAVLLLVLVVVSIVDSSPGDHSTPGADQPWWTGDDRSEPTPPSTVPPSDAYLIVGPELTFSPTPTASSAEPGRAPVKRPPPSRIPSGDDHGQRYEAEQATVTRGTVQTNHAGYSGAGFVDYENEVGSTIRWTVRAAAAGRATLTIRYANGTAPSRPMDIAVNGTVVAANAAFGATGGWSAWRSRTFTVPLVAGANTVTATATGPDGGPNIDYVEID